MLHFAIEVKDQNAAKPNLVDVKFQELQACMKQILHRKFLCKR